MNTFPWNIFFVLVIGAVIGTLAVLPYSLAINPIDLSKPQTDDGKKAKKMPTLPVIILASLIQGSVLMAIAAFVGLLAIGKTGLDLPIIRAAVNGQPFLQDLVGKLPLVIVLGLIVGFVILVLEKFAFQPRLPKPLLASESNVPLWKRAAACFYGGINEEILIRLFVMGGLYFLIGLVWKTPDGLPAVGAFWLANILSAILFGLGHLPATKRITPLTKLVIGRAVILNGIPGLVFGYLFLQYGLETAMLTHFFLDVVIHMISPRFLAQAARPAETLLAAD